VTDVLETHAHIDHIGRLPMIFKNGFTPNVLATPVTAAFMKPMLENSAEIQEEENPQNRLYDRWDVVKALRHVKTIEPFETVSVGQKRSNVTAEFLINGHVMGSASILIRDGNYGKNILFTGDMGKPEQSLCGGHKEYGNEYPKDPINILVVESTSFDRTPVDFEQKKKKFMEEINETLNGGGNPVFPTLSFHRAQEIIELFHNCQESGELPADCEIIIDAPLAIKLLKVLKGLGPEYLSKRYGEDPIFYETDQSSIGRFDLANLTIIGSHKESLVTDRKFAQHSGKAIILASGGMGGHGRAVNYIRGNFAKNSKNAILFSCYQVAGTEGYDLVHQEHSKSKKTGAKVIKLEGFTSHVSGPEETFSFLNRFNLDELETVIITHGKDSARVLMEKEFRSRGFKGDIILSEINQVIKC
jgi:metallo-beta-lactamase family protein